MIFSWANKQLEKLSETMAPLSNSATSQFLQALQNNDIQTAKSLLSTGNKSNQGFNDHGSNAFHGGGGYNTTTNNANNSFGEGQMTLIDPHTTTFHPHKQTKAIHITCQYSNTLVYNYILSTFYSNDPAQVLLQTDAVGNTVLHYACLSTSHNALSFVQFLIEAYKTYNVQQGISQKNSNGQTAYDVSSNDLVRQYLLPIQLQFETQECLNNGGVGLPQGIDLGGLKIQNRNLAPPPIMMGGGGAGGAGGAGGGTGGGGPPPMNGSSGGANMYSMKSSPMSRYAIPNELKVSSPSPSATPTPHSTPVPTPSSSFTQTSSTTVVSPSPYMNTTTFNPASNPSSMNPCTSSPTSQMTNAAASSSSTTVATNNSSRVNNAVSATETNLKANASNTISDQPLESSSLLPKGWVERIDPSSNRPYYCNQELNVSQWHRPVVLESATKDEAVESTDTNKVVERLQESKTAEDNVDDTVVGRGENDDNTAKAEETVLSDVQSLKVSNDKEVDISSNEMDMKTNTTTTTLTADKINADENVKQVVASEDVLKKSDENPMEDESDVKNENKDVIEMNSVVTDEKGIDETNQDELVSSNDQKDDQEEDGKKDDKEDDKEDDKVDDEKEDVKEDVKEDDNGNQKDESAQSEQNELPAGWTELFDQTTGRSYFYNQRMNVTQWDRPSGPTTNNTTIETTGNKSISMQSDLPQGWNILQDPASGRPYYYNERLNLTQWEKPALTSTTTSTATTATGTQQASTTSGSSKGDKAMGDVVSSSTYAKRGYSSAGVLPSNAKYKPDGFHSSSSDKKLQQKYGHDASITGPPSGHSFSSNSNIAPPPSSGNYNSGNLSLGHNPYAGGMTMRRSHYPTNTTGSGSYGAYNGGMSYQQSPQVLNNGYAAATNYHAQVSNMTSQASGQYNDSNSFANYNQQTQTYVGNHTQTNYNTGQHWGNQQNQESVHKNIPPVNQQQKTFPVPANVAQVQNCASNQVENKVTPNQDLSASDLFDSSPQLVETVSDGKSTVDEVQVDVDLPKEYKAVEVNESNVSTEPNIETNEETTPASASQLFDSSISTSFTTKTKSDEVHRTELPENKGVTDPNPSFSRKEEDDSAPVLDKQEENVQSSASMFFGGTDASSSPKKEDIVLEEDNRLPPPPMISEESNIVALNDSGDDILSPPPIMTEGLTNGSDDSGILPPPPDIGGQPESCEHSENDDDDLLPPPPMMEISLDQ